MKWIQSYLAGRNQVVEIETFTSQQLEHPACSVIQGSIGTCILYMIYVADLPFSLHDHGPQSASQEAESLDPTATTYVDDIFADIHNIVESSTPKKNLGIIFTN